MAIKPGQRMSGLSVSVQPRLSSVYSAAEGFNALASELSRYADRKFQEQEQANAILGKEAGENSITLRSYTTEDGETYTVPERTVSYGLNSTFDRAAHQAANAMYANALQQSVVDAANDAALKADGDVETASILFGGRIGAMRESLPSGLLNSFDVMASSHRDEMITKVGALQAQRQKTRAIADSNGELARLTSLGQTAAAAGNIDDMRSSYGMLEEAIMRRQQIDPAFGSEQVLGHLEAYRASVKFEQLGKVLDDTMDRNPRNMAPAIALLTENLASNYGGLLSPSKSQDLHKALSARMADRKAMLSEVMKISEDKFDVAYASLDGAIDRLEISPAAARRQLSAMTKLSNDPGLAEARRQSILTKIDAMETGGEVLAANRNLASEIVDFKWGGAQFGMTQVTNGNDAATAIAKQSKPLWDQANAMSGSQNASKMKELITTARSKAVEREDELAFSFLSFKARDVVDGMISSGDDEAVKSAALSEIEKQAKDMAAGLNLSPERQKQLVTRAKTDVESYVVQKKHDIGVAADSIKTAIELNKSDIEKAIDAGDLIGARSLVQNSRLGVKNADNVAEKARLDGIIRAKEQKLEPVKAAVQAYVAGTKFNDVLVRDTPLTKEQANAAFSTIFNGTDFADSATKRTGANDIRLLDSRDADKLVRWFRSADMTLPRPFFTAVSAVINDTSDNARQKNMALATTFGQMYGDMTENERAFFERQIYENLPENAADWLVETLNMTDYGQDAATFAQRAQMFVGGNDRGSMLRRQKAEAMLAEKSASDRVGELAMKVVDNTSLLARWMPILVPDALEAAADEFSAVNTSWYDVDVDASTFADADFVEEYSTRFQDAYARLGKESAAETEALTSMVKTGRWGLSRYSMRNEDSPSQLVVTKYPIERFYPDVNIPREMAYHLSTMLNDSMISDDQRKEILGKEFALLGTRAGGDIEEAKSMLAVKKMIDDGRLFVRVNRTEQVSIGKPRPVYELVLVSKVNGYPEENIVSDDFIPDQIARQRVLSKKVQNR